MHRRDFLHLAAFGGGAVCSAGLAGCATGSRPGAADFHFVQLSDVHWGFKGPPNPDAQGTLPKAVAAVNALASAPDFIVFTGDLTHTTDDPVERRRRMAEFKQIVSGLAVKDVRFMPGEHDAALDRGAAFKEFFGPTYYSFDHKGVHFIALDNVSDSGTKLGAEQIEWLRADLANRPLDVPVVVLAHRPLFDLVPKWDWHTRDGAEALALLMPHPNVTVFFGHIHQELHRSTGHIAHHSAKSLIFPLPAPGTAERPVALPWDPAAPYRGLGWREVTAQTAAAPAVIEHAVQGAVLPAQPVAQAAREIELLAQRFRFTPSGITLRVGEPVVLLIGSLDFTHGFHIPDLDVRADLVPGRITRVAITPKLAGVLAFACDNFCGDHHEEMHGQFTVTA